MKIRKRNIFRIIWFTIVGIFMIWNWSTYQSRNLPADTFDQSENVEVSEDSDMITFKPLRGVQSLDVLFFQGGLTDPKAYAPLCRSLAEAGYTCHLLKMNWRMPQWDYEKISDLFNLGSGFYVLGGHSQGGKMAAQFVHENPGLLKGLFLLGTSHPRDIDMSSTMIPTMKLYAENDGLASVEEVIENKKMLPENSKLIIIKGGNHSQFGYLGKLLLDDSPDISIDVQQNIVRENLLEFLTSIK